MTLTYLRYLTIRLATCPANTGEGQPGRCPAAKRGPPLTWISSLLILAPLPCGGLFPRAVVLRSPDKEVFQHMLPIHRRKRVFADLQWINR